MSIHFKYDKEKDALYGSLEGQIAIEEIDLSVKEITGSKEFSADVKTLWDMRKSDFVKINSTFVQKAVSARRNTPQRGNAKIAYIVGSNLGFGVMRLYEVLSADLPQKIMVFRDYSEGEKWLLS